MKIVRVVGIGIGSTALVISLTGAKGCGGPETEPRGLPHQCQVKGTGYYKFSNTQFKLRISDNPAATDDFGSRTPYKTGKYGCGPNSTVTFTAKTTVNKLDRGTNHRLTCQIYIDGKAVETSGCE